MKRWLAAILVVMVMAPALVMASTVRLAWNKPAVATGIVGYTLHFGTAPGVHTQQWDVIGNQDTLTATLDVGLGDARSVYIVATSRDAAGNRSAKSNEVMFSAPDDLPPDAPLQLRISVSVTKQPDGSFMLSDVRIFPPGS